MPARRTRRTPWSFGGDSPSRVGEFVQKGMPIAAISAEPTEPHLHFEVWAVVDATDVAAPDWPGDADLVPIDPTLTPDARLAVDLLRDAYARQRRRHAAPAGVDLLGCRRRDAGRADLVLAAVPVPP